MADIIIPLTDEESNNPKSIRDRLMITQLGVSGARTWVLAFGHNASREKTPSLGLMFLDSHSFNLQMYRNTEDQLQCHRNIRELGLPLGPLFLVPSNVLSQPV